MKIEQTKLKFDDRFSRQIAYNDPEIGIKYPINHPILAESDLNLSFYSVKDM